MVGWKELAEKVYNPIKMKRGWGNERILDDEGCQDQDGIASYPIRRSRKGRETLNNIEEIAFPNTCVILTRV
jgi:hypothetical protein